MYAQHFLSGDLEEDVYMEQPQGFNDNSGRVCKLCKALYGLKQASRAWYEKLDDFLTKLEFNQSTGDPNIYYKHDGHKITLVIIYVDDIIITGNDMESLISCKKFYHECL